MLGVQLDFQDQSTYYFKRSFFGNKKVYDGDSYSMILFPGQTKSLDFIRFVNEPFTWTFNVSTSVSDAAFVRFKFYSTWVPRK